jgi:outer membrane protein W
MKTSIICMVLVLSLTVLSNGQNLTGKGTFSINGTISFTSTSQENVDNNTSVLILNPGVDYFIIDNFSLGLALSIQDISYGSSSNTTWGVGPSARYYLNEEKAKPFLLIAYSYAKQNSSGSNNDITQNNIQLGVGMDYFISDNVAVESLVSYTFINIKYPAVYSYYSIQETKAKALAIGIGLNVFLR